MCVLSFVSIVFVCVCLCSSQALAVGVSVIISTSVSMETISVTLIGFVTSGYILNWQGEMENNRGRNKSESEEGRAKVREQGGGKGVFPGRRVEMQRYVNAKEEWLPEDEDGGRIDGLFLFHDF